MMKSHLPQSFFVVYITKLYMGKKKQVPKLLCFSCVSALAGKAVQFESGRARTQENAEARRGEIQQGH